MRLAARNNAIGSTSPSSTRPDFDSRKLPPLCLAAVHYLNTEEVGVRPAAAVAAPWALGSPSFSFLITLESKLHLV